ncbi:MAG: hypothetical protein KDC44_02800, partial [Phaeodactylibacter sp.]|nr:hypothetical protein [Phaeodactylibacter sp.]
GQALFLSESGSKDIPAVPPPVDVKTEIQPNAKAEALTNVEPPSAETTIADTPESLTSTTPNTSTPVSSALPDHPTKEDPQQTLPEKKSEQPIQKALEGAPRAQPVHEMENRDRVEAVDKDPDSPPETLENEALAEVPTTALGPTEDRLKDSKAELESRSEPPRENRSDPSEPNPVSPAVQAKESLQGSAPKAQKEGRTSLPSTEETPVVDTESKALQETPLPVESEEKPGQQSPETPPETVDVKPATDPEQDSPLLQKGPPPEVVATGEEAREDIEASDLQTQSSEATAADEAALQFILEVLDSGALPEALLFPEAWSDYLKAQLPALIQSYGRRLVELILPKLKKRHSSKVYTRLLLELEEQFRAAPRSLRQLPTVQRLLKTLQLRRQLLAQADSQSTAKPPPVWVSPSTETRQSQALPGDESYFIKNAGAVILWPFLSAYFQRLDLLDARKRFKDIAAQELAVHLVEYLATRHTNTPEHLLIFNKVLCGLPIDHPIPREVSLPAGAQEVGESLLRAVIQQWTALKNTSEDGLRGGFLIRDGQLKQEEKNWKVIVEKKPYDLLVERLPWSLAMIRLPWNPYFIYTEWR